jgi:hypothetical protein
MILRAGILCVLSVLRCPAQSSRISTDQKWIASTDEGQLSITPVSGTNHSAPFGSERIGWQLVWSPSEDTIAVVRNEGVYTLSEKDGWRPVKAFEGEEKAIPLGLLFSRDGRQLAISLHVTVPDRSGRGNVTVVPRRRQGEGPSDAFRRRDPS